MLFKLENNEPALFSTVEIFLLDKFKVSEPFFPLANFGQQVFDKPAELLPVACFGRIGVMRYLLCRQKVVYYLLHGPQKSGVWLDMGIVVGIFLPAIGPCGGNARLSWVGRSEWAA